MKIILILLLLINPTVYSALQSCPAVRIMVVGQRECKNCSEHVIGIDRHITFVMTNKSDRPIYVYGMGAGAQFYPTGYQVKLDHCSGKWLYDSGQEMPPPLEKRSEYMKETRVLRPGESLSFYELMGWLDHGRRFRQTVYVSFEGAEACQVMSEEFVIEGESRPPAPCPVKCTRGVSQSPEVFGLRLGMSVAQVKALYPSAWFSKPLDAGVMPSHVNFPIKASPKLGSMSVSGVGLVFVNDRLSRLTVRTWDAEDPKARESFVSARAEGFGLAGMWPPALPSYKCADFIIRVWDDSHRAVVIEEDAVRGIIDKAISDSWTKRQ